MKFDTLVSFSLLALASAQSTITSAPTATASLSPQASCAKTCGATDICCSAACYSVPCPNQSMADDTNSCVAACPQGSGTPADATSYASCEQACFTSHFFPASATGAAGAGATTTGGSSGATATAGSGSGSSGSGSGSGASAASSASGSSSATGSSSASSSTHTGAANRVEMAVSGAGLFGLLAAALAL